MKVSIITNSNIIFPTKCVVCGEECLNEEIEIKGFNDYEGYFERWRGLLNSNPKIKVPMHEPCHAIIQSKESIHNKIIIAIILLSIAIIFLITKNLNRWYFILALLSAAIIDFFLKKYIFTTYFSFSKNEYRYEFDFCNERIAEDFKQLNIDELFDVGKLIGINLKR